MSLGITAAVLNESIDALLEPVTFDSLISISAQLPNVNRVIGFVMPGNVPGAGIHELCLALLAGAGVLIKSASAEPFFFPNFLRSLADIDAAVGAHAAVVNFNRANTAATRELWAACDGGMVAYGDNASIDALRTLSNSPKSHAHALAAFGSRQSGALVALNSARPSAAESATADSAAEGLARDVVLFEQRGCLSPHHVFVIGETGKARDFAERLARALSDAALRFPTPDRLPLQTAAAIRGLREQARWRALAQPSGGRAPDVSLWEGDRMGWTVIYDRCGSFGASPGYRTVFVSALDSADELAARLGSAAGRLEAFALAAAPGMRAKFDALLRRLGVSYVCAPGRMQSPPIDWPHGGGAMFELLREAAQ